MNKGSRKGPTLCKHKRTGRGYAKFNGRQVWFGPYHDRETHTEFAIFKARWEQDGRQLPDNEPTGPFLTCSPETGRLRGSICSAVQSESFCPRETMATSGCSGPSAFSRIASERSRRGSALA